MPPFSLVNAPAVLAGRPSQLYNAPLLLDFHPIPGFGGVFEPRYIIRARPFDQ